MARPATAAVRLLTGEREPVRLATTANLETVIVDGVAWIQGLKIIDGVQALVGDRVLVKDQDDARLNGIYTASEGYWYRAADARTSRTMQKGTTVHVQEGVVSASFVFSFQTPVPAVGRDEIVLAFFNSDDLIGDATAAVRGELAAVIAEAERARDLAQQYAADAVMVSGVNVPIHVSVAAAAGAIIAAGVKAIRTQFYAPVFTTPATLVGGANYARMSLAAITAGNYPALSRFRSTDRFMPNGTVDAVNGGYWVLVESIVDLHMLGGGQGDANADTAALIAAIQLVDGKGRGTIRLPPTNVTINQTIDITFGLFNIDGFGRDVSTVTSVVVNGAPLFRSVGHLLRLGIRDFKVLGNQLTGASGNGHAFALWDTDGISSGSALPQSVIMERVVIDGFRGTGPEGGPLDSLGSMPACAVNNKGGLGCVFRDVEVLRCGGGIYMGNTQNCLIANPLFSQIDRFGILDYRSASLRIINGDVQDCCRVGADLTVPAAIPTGNIVSYFGNGTVIEGVKTKGAGGNCQIYVRDGAGVKVRKNWLQVYMLNDVPHNGIIMHRTTGFSVNDNTFDMSQSTYLASQKNQGIQITNDQANDPVSGSVRGNQFRFSPGMGISSFIRVGAPSGNRLFAGLVIENNTLGGFLAPSSGTIVDDGILVENAKLVGCRISNNTFDATSGVTFTNGIRFASVTDGGKNWLGGNAMNISGGAITSPFSGITESELRTVGQVFVNPTPAIATGSTFTVQVSLPGAVRGDMVVGVGFTADLLGCTIKYAGVVTADLVDIVIANDTGLTKDPGSGVMTVVVRKWQFGG
ncbi:right-handed parallel beta-helix repeat-containing protein [Mesorhizobium sp. M0152]|uniref:right-handed parallel beta-helix repeat-containing protein n=1 Tax=Mesorhizobium sp. M0152 TaxID=2956898 RepID=UPI00333990E3